MQTERQDDTRAKHLQAKYEVLCLDIAEPFEQNRTAGQGIEFRLFPGGMAAVFLTECHFRASGNNTPYAHKSIRVVVFDWYRGVGLGVSLMIVVWTCELHR